MCQKKGNVILASFPGDKQTFGFEIRPKRFLLRASKISEDKYFRFVFESFLIRFWVILEAFLRRFWGLLMCIWDVFDERNLCAFKKFSKSLICFLDQISSDLKRSGSERSKTSKAFWSIQKFTETLDYKRALLKTWSIWKYSRGKTTFSVRCFINQTFPRFSPTCFAGRKAREKFVQKKVVLEFFPSK